MINYLKDCEKGVDDRVEVGRWRLIGEVERAAEELHPQQSKDEDEQKEEEEQRQDGRQGIHEGYHKVTEW